MTFNKSWEFLEDGLHDSDTRCIQDHSPKSSIRVPPKIRRISVLFLIGTWGVEIFVRISHSWRISQSFLHSTKYFKTSVGTLYDSAYHQFQKISEGNTSRLPQGFLLWFLQICPEESWRDSFMIFSGSPWGPFEDLVKDSSKILFVDSSRKSMKRSMRNSWENSLEDSLGSFHRVFEKCIEHMLDDIFHEPLRNSSRLSWGNPWRIARTSLSHIKGVLGTPEILEESFKF